jgi:hypothetical protein
MEDELDEGTCGYTMDTNSKKLSTPGGTNKNNKSAFEQNNG